MKGKLLLFGIFFAAQVAFGAEAVGQFAKQSLGLDLTSIPFGEPAATNSGYAIVDPPLQMTLGSNEQSFSWRANAVSEQYHQKFPNRDLVFGFRDDRLAAVRITIDAVNHIADEKQSKRLRAELLQFYDELYSDDLPSRVTTRKFPFDDGSFRLKVTAACGLERESLFIMEFHITPADVKKTE